MIGWSHSIDHVVGQSMDVRLIESSQGLNQPPRTNPQQEKKAAIARNALACFGGKDKDEGRLNLEELRRFFL